MPKHAKIVPISAGRPTSQEPHKEMMVPIRNGSCLQLPFSELLPRYLRQQQAQETAQAETTRPKRRKLIYLPTPRSDERLATSRSSSHVPSINVPNAVIR